MSHKTFYKCSENPYSSISYKSVVYGRITVAKIHNKDRFKYCDKDFRRDPQNALQTLFDIRYGWLPGNFRRIFSNFSILQLVILLIGVQTVERVNTFILRRERNKKKILIERGSSLHRASNEVQNIIETYMRGVVVKALRYKPAGRGFDSRWCYWNFSVT